jgi:tripartite-type tricarboxylate transporter receptor subunit TctC
VAEGNIRMIDNQRRRLAAGLALAPVIAGVPAIARAQTKPLTIVITVTPGTASDILARLIGERLGVKLNRPVVVEGKPGGGGVVAIQYLKRFDPGSYLLLAPTTMISLLPLFSAKLPFEDKDILPICEVASAPHAITVNAASGFNTFNDYVEGVRKDPKLGSVGTPTPAGLASLLIYQIKKSLKVELQPVAYRGGTQILTDLLGSQITASATVMPDYLVDHKAGRLRILAHASEKRSPLAPDVPTFVELGHPTLVAVTSWGFFARGGTPVAMVNDYAAAVTEALGTAAVADRMRSLGLENVGGAAPEFQRKLAGERARWAPLIRETGMKIDA